MIKTPYKWGQLHGNVPVSADVAAKAAAVGRSHYEVELERDFCGDDVATEMIPRWAPLLTSWWPTKQLAAMGFKLLEGDARHGGNAWQDLVVTLGVDPHTDDRHGPVLCYVLHNDAMAFRQRGYKGFVPVAGDWFVFDDRIDHEVKTSKKKDGVFVGWTVPLETLNS